MGSREGEERPSVPGKRQARYAAGLTNRLLNAVGGGGRGVKCVSRPRHLRNKWRCSVCEPGKEKEKRLFGGERKHN